MLTMTMPFKDTFTKIFPQWSHEGEKRIQWILDIIGYLPYNFLEGEEKYQELIIRLGRERSHRITITFFHPDGEAAASAWSRPILDLLSQHIDFQFNVITLQRPSGDEGAFDQCFPFPRYIWVTFEADGIPIICIGSVRSTRSRYGGPIYNPTCPPQLCCSESLTTLYSKGGEEEVEGKEKTDLKG
jgi:hypothetical protein